MYQLLIPAITSVASGLIDACQRGAERRQAADTAKFEELLNKVSPTPKPTPAEAMRSKLEALRTHLLDAPEVRAAIETSDPTKPLSIQLSPDGKITVRSGDGFPHSLTLSVETQELAKEVSSVSSVLELRAAAAKAPTHIAQVATSLR